MLHQLSLRHRTQAAPPIELRCLLHGMDLLLASHLFLVHSRLPLAHIIHNHHSVVRLLRNTHLPINKDLASINTGIASRLRHQQPPTGTSFHLRLSTPSHSSRSHHLQAYLQINTIGHSLRRHLQATNRFLSHQHRNLRPARTVRSLVDSLSHLQQHTIQLASDRLQRYRHLLNKLNSNSSRAIMVTVGDGHRVMLRISPSLRIGIRRMAGVSRLHLMVPRAFSIAWDEKESK